jgi:membrane protease YdiL (CAAX protease family)
MQEEPVADVVNCVTDARMLLLQKRQYNTIIITGIAIAVLFHPVVVTLALTKSMPLVFRVIFSEIITWGTLPLLYLYALRVEDRPFLLWKESSRSFWFYVASIAILFVLTSCANIISDVPRRLGYHDDYTIMKYYHELWKTNTSLLVLVCVTAGFTEELLIRAYILPRLFMLFKNSYLPILVSAVIFSLLHLGYRNLSECIFTFLFGLICALFYKKYQNIQILIIFHFLYDLFVLLR